MPKWFRSAAPLRETAIAMIDPRPGNAVVFLGADVPRVAGETGAITGLNGRTVVVDHRSDRARRVELAAGKAGALVEFVTVSPGMLPFEAHLFDVAVVADLTACPESDRPMLVTEAVRVIRPGGRVILIAGEKRGGVFALVPSRAPKLAIDTVLALMTTAGAVACRRLAETGGVAYYEGRKEGTAGAMRGKGSGAASPISGSRSGDGRRQSRWSHR